MCRCRLSYHGCLTGKQKKPPLLSVVIVYVVAEEEDRCWDVESEEGQAIAAVS